MESNKWKKIEDEDGYPCYIDETTGKQHYNHPEFLEIIEKLKVYDGIKYAAYRIAFKIYELQKQLKVPCLRISSGVFSRHQLSLSESSLSLETPDLEVVLGDIYFAAEKEGQFSGDVDLAVDLIINLLLNVYDRERKEPIRVLAAKTLLIILSEDSASAKWSALAKCAADHNGCVSQKRLTALLSHITALPTYLGSTTHSTQLQEDADACFEKNVGMVGVSTRAVAEWGARGNSSSSRWLSVVQRVADSRQEITTTTAVCYNCHKPLIQMLKFQCTKCNEVYFCEKCYLYETGAGSTTRGRGGRGGPRHKNTHLVQELIDGQSKIPQCVTFMQGMKRFFFCTKTKKRKTVKVSRPPKHRSHSVRRAGAGGGGGGGRPAMVTSTVGKAEGHREATPTVVLNDIINQLETQDKVLEELSNQLTASDDAHLKVKVNDHWTHISTQITRLKAFKDNLSSQTDLPTESNPDKPDRPQAFDLFSPIPIVAKQPRVADNQSRVADKQSRVADKQSRVADNQSKVADKLSNQPRVLSLDSGTFSVMSKSGSQHLLTVSGDALRPVLQTSHTDTVSTVSVNDISSWYNEQDSIASDRKQRKPSSLKPATTLQANPTFTTIGPTDRMSACEADIRSVEHSTVRMKEVNADLDTVLDRLHQILANNFDMDESMFDNSQLRETATEMEGLLGTLIRGVELRATLHDTRRQGNAIGV